MPSASHRHDAVRAVARNSGWLLADRAARAILGVVVGAWVARHLGPASFGTLAYVLAFVGLFQAIATAGADTIVVREIARRPDDAHRILGSALALRLAAGAAAWCMATVAAAVVSGGDSQVVLLCAIVGGSLVFQAADVVDLWFQSRSESRRTVVAKFIVVMGSAAVKVALILLGAPLVAFAMVTALEALASAAALAIAYRRCRTSSPWRANPATVRDLLMTSWPLMASSLAILAYMRLDQILIRELLGTESLGIYSAVLPFSQLWTVLPTAAAVSIAPFLARQQSTDRAAYQRVCVLMFRGYFYGGAATAVITWLLAPAVVQELLGPAYLAGVDVLRLHAWSNAFCFLGIAQTLWLTNSGQTRITLAGALAAGVVSVGLNLYLLPTIGLLGAAWSAIAAQLMAAFLINAMLDRRGFVLQLKAIAWQKVI